MRLLAISAFGLAAMTAACVFHEDSVVDACAGLALDRCEATPGCVADHCFACSCTPAFAGCRGATEPAHECPQLGCPQPLCCRDDQECGTTLACVGPSDPPGCGACDNTPGSCTSDAGCTASGTICAPIRCSCSGASTCVPGCMQAGGAACTEGEACDPVTDRCLPRACDAVTACRANFDCAAGHCVRRACSDDRVCDDVCVNGACERSLGECRPPAV